MANENNNQKMNFEISEEQIRESAEIYGVKITKVEPGTGGLRAGGKKVTVEELFEDWSIPGPDDEPAK